MKNKIFPILLFAHLFIGISTTAFAQRTWIAPRPGPGADNTSSWYNPANWSPAGVPAATDDVIIQSGTNTCFIPAVAFQTPNCLSLTIQNNAAVFNQSGLASAGGPLTITNNLEIQDGGYYFSENPVTIVGRDLWIRGGTVGGTIIVVNNTNEIRVGRNFVNQGAMAKRQIVGTFINITFNTAQESFIYAAQSSVAPAHNRTANTFQQENLAGRAGFAFGYLIAGAAPFNILKTGAFDNFIINKQNSATVRNSGDTGSLPGGTATTTNVFLPFLAGSVGDGVNDFDVSGTPDPKGALLIPASGNFNISTGSVIVNDVTGITGGVAVTNGTPIPISSDNFYAYDNTTQKPAIVTAPAISNRAAEPWAIPAADIDVRGDLSIADANFGLPSYNGASLDLFTAPTKQNICLRLGGNLTDNGNLEPSQAVGQRRGFFIGPVDQIYFATENGLQDRPVVVFNGQGNQIITGFVSNLRDYNNIANQGTGICLPNVSMFKPSATQVSLSPNTNIRIFGDFSLFGGIFNINGNAFLFGDANADQINVMATGANTNATPTTFGTFLAPAGSRVKLCTTLSNTIIDTNNDTGAFLRGRKGGVVQLEGTATNYVEITREARPGSRIRVAFYSGCFVRVRFTSFDFPSNYNDDYALATDAPTDNNTGGTNSRGSIKVYAGTILYNYTTSAFDPNPGVLSTAARHSFSDCNINGVNATTILTINTLGFLNFQDMVLVDSNNDNQSITSQKSEGQLNFINSSGTGGGIFGELKDAGAAEGTGTGIFPADRITWQTPPVAIWRGGAASGSTTAWSNPLNWIIVDQPGGCSGCGPTYNPDNLVPGIGGFTNVTVTIPRVAFNDPTADVNFTIDGSLIMESSQRGTNVETTNASLAAPYNALGATVRNRMLTVNTGQSVTINGDVVMYWGQGLTMSGTAEMRLGNNFSAFYCTNSTSTDAFNATTATPRNTTIVANAGSTFTLIGSNVQEFTVRHNQLFNIRVDKTGGLAKFQGVIFQTNADGTSGAGARWAFRINGSFTILQGIVRFMSQTTIDITQNYVQDAGELQPLSSAVYLRNNYTVATGSTMQTGSGTFFFHPANGNTNINLNIPTGYKFNALNFGGALFTTRRREIRSGTTEAFSTNTSNSTFNLQSDLTAIGLTTIDSARTVLNIGRNLIVTGLTVNLAGNLTINSSFTTQGTLQVASNSTVTIQSGARFNLIGTPNLFTQVTRSDVLGRFAFTVNGTISARYFIFEYTNANGVNLTSTANSVSPGIITTGGGGTKYTNPLVSVTPLYAGGGGAITATLAGTPITSINVISTGSGYNAAPLVSFAGGSGAGASATAVLTGSPISDVSLISGGTGYTSAPTITPSGGGGTGFTAIAILAPAAVTAVNVGAGGSGYTTAPTVNFGGPGTGATATAVLAPSGVQTGAIGMVAPGTGYSASPTITLVGEGGTGTGATATAAVLAGAITSITITASGTGYVYPIEIIITDPTGTGAVANTSAILVNPTSVASVLVTAGGSGYTAAPTVTFTGGGGTGATATSVASAGGGVVVDVQITSPGTGYITAPTLSFTGGGGTGAAATAITDGGRVTSVNVVTGGTYTALPNVVIDPPPGPGGSTATAIADGNGGTVTGFNIVTAGVGYRTAPIITISDGGGGIGTGASARAKINPSPVTAINILSGGAGYATAPTLTVVSANGDGSGATATCTVSGGVITTVTIVTPGTGYTTGPNVLITGGGGSGASLFALLNPSPIASVALTPVIRFPVASFSDGIFTNSAFGVGAAALRVDAAYNTYRTTNPAGWTVADWNYSAASSATAGPRVDTIYNSVFPKNPAIDVGGSFTASSNVRRVGTSNTLSSRIVFLNSIGTFSGEDYDLEDNVTALTAGSGTPNPTQLNPNGVAANDSMIVWRDPNVKRWDGGPDNLGTAWSDPANWRPDGVPTYLQDVIIDYTFLNVNYGINAASTITVNAPSPFNINMDYDFNPFPASAKSLTINPLILGRFAGQAAQRIPITINLQNANFRIGGTIALGQSATLNNTVGATGVIDVGESWSNNGSFVANGGLVNFYKDASRTISTTLTTPKDANNNLTGIANGFNRVTMAAGTTSLSTDILATGDLTIGTGATFDISERFVYLNTNWINNGNTEVTNSTVYFRGGGAQSITKNITPIPNGDIRNIKQDFYNLTVNTSGNPLVGNTNHVTLNNRVEIVDGGRLTLLNGRVLSSPHKEMILAENATLNPSVSSLSFVQGPMGRIFSSGSTASAGLDYPVGSQRGGGAVVTVSGVGGGGIITGLTISNGGQGYTAGQVLPLAVTTAGGTVATITISSVNASGSITGLTITNPGTNYATGNVLQVLGDGRGQAVYVGDVNGSIGFQNLRLDNNSGGLPDRPTMMVIQQIESPSPATRTIPPAATYNYVSTSRHWRVSNLPYRTTGNLDLINNWANNLEFRSANVKIWFDANNEVITGLPANSIIPLLANVRIVKDSLAIYNAASGTAAGYTPNTAAQHDLLADRGLAYSGSIWQDMGGVSAVGGPSLFVVSNNMATMADGTFALAFNYTALPLDLLDLEAKLAANRKEVNLSWMVGNVTPTQYFELERSTDGNTFRTLASVDGRGTAINANTRAYNFVDKAPAVGINYYRVQQISEDGKRRESKIVSVNVETGEVFIAYPNPISRGTTLMATLEANSGEQIDVRINDMTGRAMYQYTYDYKGSPLAIPIGRDWAEGVYIVNVKTANRVYQAKIVVTQ